MDREDVMEQVIEAIAQNILKAEAHGLNVGVLMDLADDLGVRGEVDTELYLAGEYQ